MTSSIQSLPNSRPPASTASQHQLTIGTKTTIPTHRKSLLYSSYTKPTRKFKHFAVLICFTKQSTMMSLPLWRFRQPFTTNPRNSRKHLISSLQISPNVQLPRAHTVPRTTKPAINIHATKRHPHIPIIHLGKQSHQATSMKSAYSKIESGDGAQSATTTAGSG